MNHYNCPYCRAYLNVNGFIALNVKKEGENSGVILLSEKLGDYSSHINPKLHYEEGEMTWFYCPSCSKSLHMVEDESLVRILKKDEEDEEHTVIFSAINGKQLTHQISKERQLSFGEHALKFVDPDWYKKD